MLLAIPVAMTVSWFFEARLGRPARLIRLCLIHFHTALMNASQGRAKG